MIRKENCTDFWSEYSLKIPLPFGMLDLFYFHFHTFITKWTIGNGPKNLFFFQIGTILLYFEILENVYPERKPTPKTSTWDAKIMVTFWLLLSDKVTFENDYTAKIFFRTFYVNIFLILRNKRTRLKKKSLWYLMPFCSKKMLNFGLQTETQGGSPP